MQLTWIVWARGQDDWLAVHQQQTIYSVSDQPVQQQHIYLPAQRFSQFVIILLICCCPRIYTYILSKYIFIWLQSTRKVGFELFNSSASLADIAKGVGYDNYSVEEAIHFWYCAWNIQKHLFVQVVNPLPVYIKSLWGSARCVSPHAGREPEMKIAHRELRSRGRYWFVWAKYRPRSSPVLLPVL